MRKIFDNFVCHKKITIWYKICFYYLVNNEKHNAMKKITLLLILTAVFSAFCFNASAKGGYPEKATVNGPQSPTDVVVEGDPDILWWFSIQIKIDPKKRDIEIISGSTKVSSGSKKVFEKEVWKGIARRRIVIGPFPCKQQAENATIFYKKSKDKVVGVPSGENPRELYWFQVSFNELKRIGAYEFAHSPAAVSSGSYDQFKDALFEGITFKLLSVGPFANYSDEKLGVAVDGNIWAEKAKSIYRQNE